MQYKQIPQDFIVDELYDLEDLKKKDEEKGDIYFYFKLTKINYNQIRSIQKVSDIFKVPIKRIHFAGTKDKVGITSQIISINSPNQKTLEENIDFFNKNLGPDLKIDFIGKFKSRLNLGDNLGNKFTITIRDLSQEEINLIKQNKDLIEENGVLNYFDEQRFGYANNSHIVGKYILKNEIELAVKEILTSTPPKPTEDLEKFTIFIKNNWEQIKLQNLEVISHAIELAPKFLREEVKILHNLKRFKNDFPGSFRTLHKKQRTLYLNAYQSHLFNQLVDILNKNKTLPNKLFLLNQNTPTNLEYLKELEELAKQDNISKEDFKLPSMPELKLRDATRETKIFPKNISLQEEQEDELNKDKFKIQVEFELQSGAYATNVIKQLCNSKQIN